MMVTSSRTGLSLLEVILSLAILALSTAVLAQLLESARLGAIQTERELEATTLAESIIAEVVAAETTPAEVEEEPLTEAGDWVYSLTVSSGELSTLAICEIQVLHRNELGNIDADVQLIRWLALPEEIEVPLE